MEPQRSGIYKITNLKDGKVYIGQSVDIFRRWREHKRKYKNQGVKTRLYLAMRENGIENFSFEVVEYCSKEQLNDKEQYYIKQYKSLNPELGYNMSKIEHLFKKIDESIVEEIQQLLIHDQDFTLQNKDIAERYNISHTWITLLNEGKLWHKDNLSYPLRKIQYNVKQLNYCIDCGKEIRSCSIRCDYCNRKYRSFLVTSRISREELKELIRNKPFKEIGRMYGVTDNSVRRWCDKYNLPRRKIDINGYTDEEWQQI